MATEKVKRKVAEAQTRRAEVVRLYQDGLSFADVGQAMGISRSRAFQLYNEAKARGEVPVP
jgi:DNA-binding transcriptional regulator LsrR (DeoR family)